jgi:hypothetical protein
MRWGVRVARDGSSPASERALKESTKFEARFSFALSFLLVMTVTMSDFSSLGYLSFKRNQVALNDWTTSALGAKGRRKKKVTRCLCAASLLREPHMREYIASRPRTPPERQKGRVIACFLLLLHARHCLSTTIRQQRRLTRACTAYGGQ